MASPASDDTTSNRVQCLADGEVVSTHSPPAGTSITEDAVKLRLSQQKEILEHFNFILLSTEDTLKHYVNQQEAERAQHGQYYLEAVRQRDEARGSEYTHRVNITMKTYDIDDLTKDLKMRWSG